MDDMNNGMNRRNFLQTLLAGTGGLALSGANRFSGSGQGRDGRPNIVLIMADDMGFSDIGCYGGEIHTPNLDRLAGNGLRFSQFYNYARCCPTRASLLTGLYPHQAGIGHMTSENDWTLRRNEKIADKAYQGYLNRNSMTMGEVLQGVGYQTFMTGKWHVGTWRPNWPVDRGFDRYFGIIRGASNHFHPNPDKKLLLDDQPFEPPEDFYSADYFSKYAAKFIQEADSDRPFFLYNSFTCPHWPIQAWKEDIQKYKGQYMMGWDELRRRRFARQKEMGLLPGDLQLSPRNPEAPAWEDAKNKEEWDLRMAVYAAMVDRMDQGVGRIMQALEDKGQLDNTMIVFLSDNGGNAEHYNPKPNIPPGPEESATAYFLPWANASNTPFRLFKHWVHEGGISTPGIIHWPGKVNNPGSITHHMGTLMDLMPTFVEAAQADYPEHFKGYQIQPLQGESLLPVITGDADQGHAPMFWEHEGNRAVRDGEWKLVSYYSKPRQRGVGQGKRTGPWELYNVENDRTELHNVIDEHPDIARQMINAYTRWTDRAGVLNWQEIQRRLGNVHTG